MQNFSFIAPELQRAIFQYLLNLLCTCVQRSTSIFRADKCFSWFGFQSWPNLPNFEVICVENTQLRSKNLFLHIDEETIALSHLRISLWCNAAVIAHLKHSSSFSLSGLITTFFFTIQSHRGM